MVAAYNLNDNGMDLGEGDQQLTDLGNAERLVERCKDTLRYVAGWSWMVWDGQRWAGDDAGKVMEFAKETIRDLRRQAAETENWARRKELWGHTQKSEHVARLQAMVTLAKSDPRIAARPDDFDRDTMLLNVKNGTIDLRTGQLRKHAPADLITRLSPVDYMPGTTSEVWERFLQGITCKDRDLQEYLQRAAGYSLTGRTDEECFFFCHGSGRNGKSKFIEALAYVLGDYAQAIRAESLLRKREASGAANNDIAALAGARLVSAAEPDEQRALNVSLIKGLTGGDTITARFLNKEYFTFQPQFKLWFSANHKPAIDESSDAIWERVKQVPFNAYFSPEQRDTQMGQKLRDTAAAILAWAVEGCLRWQQKGLHAPQAVREAVEEYRFEQDPVALFLKERCIVEAGRNEEAKVVLAAYAAWCRDNDEAEMLSNTALYRRLEAHRCVKRRSNSKTIIRGLALKKEDREESASYSYPMHGASSPVSDDDIPF